jgi:hypothetical protein
MMTTIKQRVAVEAGGRVAVQSPELLEGESAEVIIRVERHTDPTPEQRLKALEQLRESLNLSPDLAAKWQAEVRAERQAWRTKWPEQ